MPDASGNLVSASRQVRRALERVRRTAADEPDALCRLRALSRGQDGQFATAQARILGLKASALVWLRDRRETERLRRGVWRFRTAPGPADPAITAFLLCWPHAVISHASAARHHGLRRVLEPAQPEIVMPLTRRRAPAGVTVHVTRNLPGCDIVECGSVYYTSLARTVCDLADPRQAWESLAVLDDAVALGANPKWINQRANALATGRGAVRLVRDATAADAARVFRSWLERTAAHVYRCAALPDPEWNVAVHDDDGLVGIVDALWLPWRVISEKEGLRFQTSPHQRRADARRFNRLCDAQYAPRRFTWEDVVHQPVEVAATILKALRAAGADLDPACLPRKIAIPTRPFSTG